MIVYRISLAIYSDNLVPSGNAARWNSKDVKIIYTAESRALACLENIVHRSAIRLQKQFRLLIINVPDNVSIDEIKEGDLMNSWQKFYNMAYTQSFGNTWILAKSTAVLKVPSALVNDEFNYLLNPAHKDFSRITIKKKESFDFDDRFK